jgi:CO/xanthine dehydrogenase Mo-binding subunit
MSEKSSDDRKYKYIGTRPIRHDGLDKVTGRAQFGADYSLPGMLWGKGCAARTRTRASGHRRRRPRSRSTA